MSKNLIRLTEQDLHRVVKESVNTILNEFMGVHVPMGMNRKPAQQINNTDIMFKSVLNGNDAHLLKPYIGELPTFTNAVTQLASNNDTTYPNILKDLYSKVNNYLSRGYFGKNEYVNNTIGRFCELLIFLNGSYEGTVKEFLRKRGVLPRKEGYSRKGAILKEFTFTKPTNSYGVRQWVFDPRQRIDFKGQWMVDLQNELNEMLKFNYLHGEQTVEATKSFIEFLNVERKNIMGGVLDWKTPMMKMSKALAGVVLLASLMSYNGCGGGNANQPNQLGGGVPTQTTMTQQNQMGTVNVNFDVNSFNLNSGQAQQLKQFANFNGNLTLTVHQSQNTSGQDSSYEGHLTQQRAQSLINYLKSIGFKGNVKVVRGENSQTPYVEISPSNGTPSWQLMGN